MFKSILLRAYNDNCPILINWRYIKRAVADDGSTLLTDVDGISIRVKESPQKILDILNS